MIDEIEELHALADECREWANRVHISQGERVPSAEEYSRECKRLATKLDEIAKRLAARLPT